MNAALPGTVGAGEDVDAINDYFYERGWTDGLPIVPPTEERVEAMLAGMPWRAPDDSSRSCRRAWAERRCARSR